MTKKENRQRLMNELAGLFNANTGKKVGDACRGKWKGTTDYAVVFDNNEKYYISNGMKNFDEYLQREIDVYKQFNDNKQAIMDKLLEMQKADNVKARERDLKEYKIISLDYVKNGTRIGWFYLTISVDGINKNICETKFNYAIAFGKEKLIDYINKAKSNKFWAACGIPESEADFIFHGCGYCSTSDLYTVKL